MKILSVSLHLLVSLCSFNRHCTSLPLLCCNQPRANATSFRTQAVWSVDTTLSFWAVAPRDTRVVRLARHALARFAESGEACCHPGEAGIRRSVLPAAAGKCERVPPNHYGRQLRQTQNCERAAAGSEWPTAGSAIAHPGSQFPVRAAYPAAAIISTMLYLTYRMGAT